MAPLSSLGTPLQSGHPFSLSQAVLLRFGGTHKQTTKGQTVTERKTIRTFPSRVFQGLNLNEQNISGLYVGVGRSTESCNILHNAGLYNVIPDYTIHDTISCWIIRYYTESYRTALNYTLLYDVILDHTILYCSIRYHTG